MDGDDDADFVFLEEFAVNGPPLTRLRYFVNNLGVFVGNTLNPTFLNQCQVGPADRANTITVADVDADNDIDIVVGLVHGT